ncbi:MAG: amidophosphoribosyltransferase [Chloroflexota bacterium]|nr:amidophosphoribosyltransferase [Chloroflexota bacterium]
MSSVERMTTGHTLSKPTESCGVFGIVAPGEDVARLTYFGLYSLQHRGQEGAGIAVADGQELTCHKRMGLVSQVFTEEDLKKLTGHSAIGHNRYATSGSSRIRNAQPTLLETKLGPFALSHNGNLANTLTLQGQLRRRGYAFEGDSDSEVTAKLIAEAPGETWEDKIEQGLSQVNGSYSLVILTPEKIYGVRDPLGVRPLVLGRFPPSPADRNHGYVLASESCALDTIGAEMVRELLPGEGIAINPSGVETFLPPSEHSAFCIFEYIYFARPDSILNGKLVYEARMEMGRRLAREHPVDVDFVIGVPDSATAAAIGYAEEAHLPFFEGLIKSRYIGRTFIQPEQRLRKLGVKLKFNALPQLLRDKRIVVVDDSIVRGNTTREITHMLREAGAREIHIRITSPPLRHPCFLGVDIATYEELIAHRLTVAQICRHLGADSLGYLSLEGLKSSIEPVNCDFCTGCFTGEYPVEAS